MVMVVVVILVTIFVYGWGLRGWRGWGVRVKGRESRVW